jgi:hypothetical protein
MTAFVVTIVVAKKKAIAATLGALSPQAIEQVNACLDPGETLLQACNFSNGTTDDGQPTFVTAALTTRHLRSLTFLNGKPCSNIGIPLKAIATIGTQEAGGVFTLVFWCDGTKESLFTSNLQAGRAFVAELKRVTVGVGLVSAGGISAELAGLAILAKEGVLSAEELTQAKQLLIGKPKDEQDEAMRLLRNLYDLTKTGVVSQGEFNMKKWDILSRRHVTA